MAGQTAVLNRVVQAGLLESLRCEEGEEVFAMRCLGEERSSHGKATAKALSSRRDAEVFEEYRGTHYGWGRGGQRESGGPDYLGSCWPS